MKIVRHKTTGRLIHRTIPEFKDGEGIKSALTYYGYSADELEESTCTREEWEAELALRKQEQPKGIQEQVNELLAKVNSIDARVKAVEVKEAIS